MKDETLEKEIRQLQATAEENFKLEKRASLRLKVLIYLVT